MSGLPINEGPLETDRLTVHHLRIQRLGAPKVLLLGGSNFDLRLKRSFLDTELAQTCDLVTYEPRGIGRTQQPDGMWTMEDYAKDALSVLDCLEWKEVVVVGESFGGMTALHLAILAPHRMLALVTASATSGGPDHASYDIAEFLSFPINVAAEKALCLQDKRSGTLRASDPRTFEILKAGRVAFETAFREPSVNNGGYSRLLSTRKTHDCTAALSKINMPVTVIAGRFDLQARPNAQQALVNALPNATFHCYDAGHGVLFSNPQAMQVTMGAIRTATNTKEITQ